MYLYTALQFKAHKNLTQEKSRKTEDRVRILASTTGLATGLVKTIQAAAVQAVALYSEELLWNSERRLGEKYQKPVNRQEQALTRIFRSITMRVVVRESELRPAVSVHNNRQQKYRYRLLTAPER